MASVKKSTSAQLSASKSFYNKNKEKKALVRAESKLTKVRRAQRDGNNVATPKEKGGTGVKKDERYLRKTRLELGLSPLTKEPSPWKARTSPILVRGT